MTKNIPSVNFLSNNLDRIHSSLFLKKILIPFPPFISFKNNLFLAAVGLHCCSGAFSSCSE